ncbi:MAG TPA: hypothetical protein VK737_09825 [Opitutales bacterium]|jgi:hypothetical protein|nr:hypothetical protein [Opitutales bacterium]
MSTLARTRLRLAADAASFDAPLDVLRRATPQFWRGNDLQFELALFFNGALLDVSNLASLTLEIRPLGANGAAPDPSFAPLMGATVTSFDNTTTLDTWNSGAQQHAVIAFTATQSNIAAGAAWLSIFAITNDSPGRVITLCAGPLRVLEDGSGLATTPTPTADTFYTAAESDARYAPIGAGSGASPGSTNPLMDGTAAPGTATSYSRADHVHPTDTSRAPLASPALSGSPTAPTVSSASDSTTKIATTAFVQAAISAAGGSGGGTWGSITGTLSSQSDLNTALSAKASLASPALTGTPTAPTVGTATDSTTKIATTAFVQAALVAYTASITNDGSGHYLFGGGSYYSYPGPTRATMTVNGAFAVQSTFETAFVNNNAFGVTDTGWNANVMSIQATATDKTSAIRMLDENTYEVGAMGRGGSAVGYPWASYSFMSTSPYYDPATGTPHGITPGGIGLVWEGKDANMSAYLYYRRFEINPDGSCNFVFPYHSTDYSGNDAGGAALGSAYQLQLSGPNTSGNCYMNLKSFGNGSAGQCAINVKNNADHYINLAMIGSSFSTLQSIVANCAMLATDAPSGLLVQAQDSGGVIKFYTGGLATTNERLQIDASGNFIASNVVTSAPSATLADSQYQFCVYDNSGTATFRVRYKDASGTVKIGDLALT